LAWWCLGLRERGEDQRNSHDRGARAENESNCTTHGGRSLTDLASGGL
jgi:hypothetical protein